MLTRNFFLGCRSRNPVDAEAGQQPNQRERQQRISCINFVAVELLRHRGAGHRSDDDGEKRPQLDDAVSPGQALGRQQLRKQAILRRTE